MDIWYHDCLSDNAWVISYNFCKATVQPRDCFETTSRLNCACDNLEGFKLSTGRRRSTQSNRVPKVQPGFENSQFWLPSSDFLLWRQRTHNNLGPTYLHYRTPPYAAGTRFCCGCVGPNTEWPRGAWGPKKSTLSAWGLGTWYPDRFFTVCPGNQWTVLTELSQSSGIKSPESQVVLEIIGLISS